MSANLVSPVSRLFAVAALTLAATAALAAPRPPLPELHLPPGGISGQQAVEMLGANLEAVAAHHRMSPKALRERLLSDATLRVDPRGRLFFVEEHLPPATTRPERAPSEGVVPLEDTFTLHSRPGAQRTVYLDFNGAVITGTAWNGGGGPINAQPFDTDGNQASFSDDELETIQAIWQRVAEDFAPFDIDVTTEEPPAATLTRANNADNIYGTTALITNTAGVYNCNCGGVAYVGVFDNVGDFYKPALVFWNMLSSDEKNIAEASSHEVGHNLGLSHDGDNVSAYYDGHGSGETGWAPIMGVGYYQQLVQWSKGEYANANNGEDDFVVAQANGGPLRTDDHGNGTGSATAMSVSGSGATRDVSATGVVERATDVDYFSFSAGPGSASIDVVLADPSPNLDAKLTLRNAGGTVLASANKKKKLAASLSATLPSAGTYYVTVEGVGKGNVTGTGYSDYGSVGQYSVDGTVPAP